MPTRFREQIDADVEGYLVHTKNTGPQSDIGPIVLTEHSISMTDFVTPNYHKKIAQGAIINNSCDMNVHTVSSNGSGFYRHHLNSDPSQWTELAGKGLTRWRWGASLMSLNSPSGSGLSMDDAKLQALSNIDRTPFAFGEDLGEIRETIRFLKSPFRSLSELTGALKKDAKKVKASGRSALSISQSLADVWLEYRFALSPLIRSAYSAVDAFGYEFKPTIPPRMSARGSADWVAEDSGTVRSSTSANYYEFTYNQRRNREYKAAVLYTVSNPVRNWRYKLGLRYKDIPSTAWQLLPLSFMVDRVYNISGIIQGFTNLLDPSIKVLAASDTTKFDNATSIIYSDRKQSGYTTQVSGDEWLEENFQYLRNTWDPHASFPFPTVKPVGLVEDAPKVVDLASLILSNLSSLST